MATSMAPILTKEMGFNRTIGVYINIAINAVVAVSKNKVFAFSERNNFRFAKNPCWTQLQKCCIGCEGLFLLRNVSIQWHRRVACGFYIRCAEYSYESSDGWTNLVSINFAPSSVASTWLGCAHARNFAVCVENTWTANDILGFAWIGFLDVLSRMLPFFDGQKK